MFELLDINNNKEVAVDTLKHEYEIIRGQIGNKRIPYSFSALTKLIGHKINCFKVEGSIVKFIKLNVIDFLEAVEDQYHYPDLVRILVFYKFSTTGTPFNTVSPLCKKIKIYTVPLFFIDYIFDRTLSDVRPKIRFGFGLAELIAKNHNINGTSDFLSSLFRNCKGDLNGIEEMLVFQISFDVASSLLRNAKDFGSIQQIFSNSPIGKLGLLEAICSSDSKQKINKEIIVTLGKQILNFIPSGNLKIMLFDVLRKYSDDGKIDAKYLNKVFSKEKINGYDQIWTFIHKGIGSPDKYPQLLMAWASLRNNFHIVLEKKSVNLRDPISFELRERVKLSMNNASLVA